MTLQRVAPAFAAGRANLVLTMTTMILLLTSAGCSRGNRALAPVAPGSPIEVIGTLVALKDDRPVDGGIALTLETAQGVRELARVPGAFRYPPNDSVVAMHAVVDAAKLGDRLRARGTRDESGALRAEFLELLSP
jgi:hypothetical protein